MARGDPTPDSAGGTVATPISPATPGAANRHASEGGGSGTLGPLVSPPGAGGTTPSPARSQRRARQGSRMTTNPAKREMDEFLLYESDLQLLGQVRRGATLCFSAAAALISFWLSITQSFAFADPSVLTDSKLASWTVLWWVSLLVGIILFAFGVRQVAIGNTEIERIRKENGHGREDPNASFWQRQWAKIFGWN